MIFNSSKNSVDLLHVNYLRVRAGSKRWEAGAHACGHFLVDISVCTEGVICLYMHGGNQITGKIKCSVFFIFYVHTIRLTFYQAKMQSASKKLMWKSRCMGMYAMTALLYYRWNGKFSKRQLQSSRRHFVLYTRWRCRLISVVGALWRLYLSMAYLAITRISQAYRMVEY